jgi:hypothetical protein
MVRSSAAASAGRRTQAADGRNRLDPHVAGDGQSNLRVRHGERRDTGVRGRVVGPQPEPAMPPRHDPHRRHQLDARRRDILTAGHAPRVGLESAPPLARHVADAGGQLPSEQVGGPRGPPVVAVERRERHQDAIGAQDAEIQARVGLAGPRHRLRLAVQDRQDRNRAGEGGDRCRAAQAHGHPIFCAKIST